MKPYYEDAAVTIYHGDCRDVLPGTTHIDRVLTDPPYGTSAYEHDVAVSPELFAQFIAETRTAAVFGYAERLVAMCVAVGAAPDEWVTWWPTNTIGGSRRSTKLPRECEHIAVFGEVPGARRLFRPRAADPATRARAIDRGHAADVCRLGDVWRDPSPGVGFNHHLRLHMNEKPIALMRKLVELTSEPADVLLDPFMGSGTTLRAAKDLGRRAIGIEIEERYCEVAAERCAQDVLDFGEAA